MAPSGAALPSPLVPTSACAAAKAARALTRRSACLLLGHPLGPALKGHEETGVLLQTFHTKTQVALRAA